MRTLSEILEAVKSGQKPEYDELRYAVVALDALSSFDGMALMKLRTAEEQNKKRLLTGSAIWQHDEHWRRWRQALGKSPKAYVGWNHDPDNPAAVKFYRGANELLEKISQQQST